MLQATWRLRDGQQVPYRVLYSHPKYQLNCEKKMRKMKKIARKSNFRTLLKDWKFTDEITRIQSIYTDDGGRESLVDLIGKAFICT